MAAYLIGGGVVTPQKSCCMISLPTLNPQLQRPVILRPQPTKIKIRALSSKYGWCSVRACRDKSPSYDFWKQAVNTIDSRGHRVTIADLVSREDNLYLNRAQKAVQALAADTNGSVLVSDDGGVTYVFPQGRRLKLKIESLLEILLKKAKMVARFLVMASFGFPLVITILVGFPATLFWIFTRIGCSQAMSQCLGMFCGLWRILQYVSSVVFGDGDDPNRWIDEKKWKTIGLYIAQSGGVVVAEEIAPYLDPETIEKMDDDGSYMLPVLLRFGGHPEVDEEGNILYHFPAAYCTSTQTSRGNEFVGKWANLEIVDKFLKEEEWSNIDIEENKKVKSFLRFHLLVAMTLCIIMRIQGIETSNGTIFSKTTKGTVYIPKIFAVFAVCVEIIQLIRRSFVQQKNAKIVKRNKAREQLAKCLKNPNDSLKRKLLSAREMARKISIVYDLVEDDQKTREWDQRFNHVGVCKVRKDKKRGKARKGAKA